ncbi:hypothetical protein X777_11710 [Ooceraea biroi]|uniref:Uncharacterized protein n=1 Tax=Ooceraea biroi TaxID=2015173 RepID=A0A026W384_OOCBI|nr:hypothetical protein X777_11710 [Ooceraea biroi]
MYLYDRRAGGGGTGEERVHLFPSGHVSTKLERFDGDDAPGEKTRRTTSQTENTAA